MRRGISLDMKVSGIEQLEEKIRAVVDLTTQLDLALRHVQASADEIGVSMEELPSPPTVSFSGVTYYGCGHAPGLWIPQEPGQAGADKLRALQALYPEAVRYSNGPIDIV